MAANNSNTTVWATTATNFVSPTPVLNDYIKIGVLSCILALGGPLNAFALWQQCHEYRKALKQRKKSSEVSYLLQKIHLNFANLLLNLSYCVGFIAWYKTYSWYGGDILCRFYHTLWNTTLYASSFLVAVIAIDRLKTCIKIERARNGESISELLATGKSVLRPTKILIISAWTLSILFSFPQLAVFKVITLSPHFSQCTTVWIIQHFNQGTDTENNVSLEEKLYLTFHLLTIFWVPLIVILLCYFLIMFKELRHLRTSRNERQNNGPNSTIFAKASCSETEQTNRNSSSSIPKTLATKTIFAKLECQNETINHCVQVFSSQLMITRQVLSVSGQDKYDPGPRTFWENIEFAMKMQPKELLDKCSKPRRATNDQRRSQKQSHKLFRSSLLIVSAYVILWLSYNIVSVIALYGPIKFIWINQNLDWLTTCVILFNTIVNPFFYSYENLKRFMVSIRIRRNCATAV